MYEPRSPGFAHAGETLDKRDYVDERQGLVALTDFLKHEPPPTAAVMGEGTVTPDMEVASKEGKCKRKWILEMFKRSGSKREEKGRKEDERSPPEKKVDVKDGGKAFESEKKYERVAAADSKEVFRFEWDRQPCEKPQVETAQNEKPTREKPKLAEASATATATAAAIRKLEETFPSAPLKPPAPKFVDYDLGITEQYPHLVMANGERHESTKDCPMSTFSAYNVSTSAIRQPKTPNRGHGSIGLASSSPTKVLPLTPTQKYKYSPVQNPVYKSTPTIFPKEPYPKPRKHRPPPLDAGQTTKSAPRSVQSTNTHDIDRHIPQRQGSDGVGFPGSFGSKEEIRGLRQGNGAGIPRSFDSKEEIHNGVVFLPTISDTSLLPMAAEDPFSRSNKSNMNLRAQHAQVQPQGAVNCGLSPIFVSANQEPNGATKYENHSSDPINDGTRTREKVTETVSSNPPVKVEAPKGGCEEHQQGFNEKQVPDYAAMVAEVEARWEVKFGQRVAALEKQYRILNRLFSAMLDTSRLGASEPGPDRLSGLSTTSSLFTLEAKLDALLALVQENKRWSTEVEA